MISQPRSKRALHNLEQALAGILRPHTVASPVVPRPTYAGRWHWTHWNAEVDVYTKPGKGRRLYVVPPGGIEVPITGRIAGGWIAVSRPGENSGVRTPERRPDHQPHKVDGVHGAQHPRAPTQQVTHEAIPA